MKSQAFRALPKANQHLVAHEQPKKGDKMLYSITPEGKLKIHRDLSKWRSKVIDKKTALYYEEAPSAAEHKANVAIRGLISRCTRELTLAQEQGVVTKAMRKQAIRDALASV